MKINLLIILIIINIYNISKKKNLFRNVKINLYKKKKNNNNIYIINISKYYIY